MNIWTAKNWQKVYADSGVRKGLYLKTDRDVDDEVRQACKDFCKWLRSNYNFPIRVPIYLKASYKIKAMDGEPVSATFFEPYDPLTEPYIRIAAGDYDEMKREYGKENALASILLSVAHELTHYFQWINGIQLTERGHERQAKRYAELILDEYAETSEHL